MKKKVEKNKKIIMIISVIGILLIASLIAASYFSFLSIDKCNSFECFRNSMENCEKVEFVNDSPDAAWEYTIKGREKDFCRIDVKLLLIKKGESNIEELNGREMSCFYPFGIGDYPESNLKYCQGHLKEGIQEIIIEKLHIYILENLGKIDTELNRL